jgi:hypothetical protein
MNHVVHGPAGLLCFEKLRIEIVGTIPPGGRPRRDQLHVFESDGSLYTGQLLSPSAIGTSLMLASRRRISPRSSNSQFSLP